MPDSFPWSIAGIAIATSFGAIYKWADVHFQLKRVNKEIEVLIAHQAELQAKLKVYEDHDADSFTKPLKYPRQ